MKRTGSGQPGAARSLRRRWASVAALREVRRFAVTLRDVLQWRPITEGKYAQTYADRSDPYGYAVEPFENEKFQAALDLLDRVLNGARFQRVWEIGCAEGVLTARLSLVCERLLAADYIPLVLERARARCRQCGNISFERWDLMADPAPGPFDLIVIMDVLGSLGGRREISVARDKVVGALDPGGFLLYSDCLGDSYRRRIEKSWWARPLFRGPHNIHRLVAAHPALVVVAQKETSMHLLSLFRNKPEEVF